MSSVTRKAEYTYTLHDINGLEIDTIIGSLDYYAEKFSCCSGTVDICKALAETLFKLRNAP